MTAFLVTGGCGFIGAHLCYKLVQLGHIVYVLDNLSTGKLEKLPKEVFFTKGDVRNLDLLIELMNSVDGCFHLAALASVPECSQFWVEAHHINVSGTLNVFEAAKQARRSDKSIRVVYASSSAVYGNADQFPLKETISSPISVYGINKLFCEYYAKMANDVYQIPAVGLRLFNIYGCGQNPNSSYTGVITAFLKRLQSNEPFIIYGDGKQSRDFVFIEDAIEFFIAAMHVSLDYLNIYNVCSGVSVTIQEVGEQLFDLANVNPRYIYQPARLGDIHCSLGDPSRTSKVLGVKTMTSFADGLQSLLLSDVKNA